MWRKGRVRGIGRIKCQRILQASHNLVLAVHVFVDIHAHARVLGAQVGKAQQVDTPLHALRSHGDRLHMSHILPNVALHEAREAQIGQSVWTLNPSSDEQHLVLLRSVGVEARRRERAVASVDQRRERNLKLHVSPETCFGGWVVLVVFPLCAGVVARARNSTAKIIVQN